MHGFKKLAIIVIAIGLAVMLSGLFATRSNPPVSHTVTWDSPATEQRFRLACADCHSHETVWPWYAYVGPTAFLMTHNVEEGREHFNISVADMGEAEDSAEEVTEGEMPPWDYLLMHAEAEFDGPELDAFVAGLRATFGDDDHDDKDDEGDHEDDHDGRDDH